jgi:hypothetical protein
LSNELQLSQHDPLAKELFQILYTLAEAVLALAADCGPMAAHAARKTG